MGLAKLVSSRIFFCQLRNLLAVLFFLFSLDVALAQGSPNFFFNGPDDNVDLWSRARFEGNIIERLCNFTDLNIERI